MTDCFFSLNLNSFKIVHNKHIAHLLLDKFPLWEFSYHAHVPNCVKGENFLLSSNVKAWLEFLSQKWHLISPTCFLFEVSVWYKCWPSVPSQHYSSFQIHVSIKLLPRFLQNWLLTIVQVLIICTVTKQLPIGMHWICSCYSFYCCMICSLCDGKDLQA